MNRKKDFEKIKNSVSSFIRISTSKALLKTGKVESMPPYEDVIRPFKMDASKEFTDVWNFPSVRPYKGKHPAEKPVVMNGHLEIANPRRYVLNVKVLIGIGKDKKG
jgi:hypothetical protein